MFELLFEWIAEDGGQYPISDWQERALQTCEKLPDDFDHAPFRERTVYVDNGYGCYHVRFESFRDCMFTAPTHVGREIQRLWNGAEGPYGYGVKWRCVATAIS